MYVYRVTFGDGVQNEVRANSPKEAWEKASAFGLVSHIKWLR